MRAPADFTSREKTGVGGAAIEVQRGRRTVYWFMNFVFDFVRAREESNKSPSVSGRGGALSFRLRAPSSIIQYGVYRNSSATFEFGKFPLRTVAFYRASDGRLKAMPG